MQDPGTTREVCPDETLVLGKPFEGFRRGFEQGLVANALMRAEKRAQGLRDGEGEEEVWPGQLLLPVVREPLLGFMLLALRAVTIATGMMAPVVLATALTLIEAVSVMAATALLDGANDLLM